MAEKINFKELQEARSYCSKMMERYICILDNATYMQCEHIQKEKEYGIPWRSAFKTELNELVLDLQKRTMEVVEDLDGPKLEIKEPFVLLHQIVKKDVIDAATFDTRTQAEYMCLLLDQLEMLEKCVFQIKALLKQPDFQEFEKTKEAKQAELREWQTSLNLERPNTAELNRK